jgi:hypothetical protein
VSTAFRRTREGTIIASIHPAEAELIGSLAGQLVQLFRDVPGDTDSGEGWASALGLETGSGDRPTDPVVLRLFPDGYRDDDESAADFRRYTEPALREAKLANATTVIASLATAGQEGASLFGGRDKLRIELDADQAQSWLLTLTDLRLALGTRLGVEQDDDDHWRRLPADDPRRHIHDVYDWLGWVQETLVRALSAGLG